MEDKYPINLEDAARNARNFSYHPPTGETHARTAHLHSEAKRFADVILHHCPLSRERYVALTELETACMWAAAAISRNEMEEPSTEEPSHEETSPPDAESEYAAHSRSAPSHE